MARHRLVSTLLEWFEKLSPAFTKPSLCNALIIFLGWVQICGGHAVTGALVAAGVAGRRHHEAFHRFFSRSKWSTDELGRLLFLNILALLPATATIEVVIDDTLAKKSGPKIFGLGTHVDPVQSTRKHTILAFGHVWVVLSVVLLLPFSKRPWALPVLFRLYRSEKDCTRRRTRHRTKPELAHEMLEVLLGWAGGRRVRVAADAAYSNRPVLHGLTDRLTFVGAMRPDVALRAAPETSEHGRRYGAPLPKPKEILADPSYPWHTCTVNMYGHAQTIRYKTIDAYWQRVTRSTLLRIVYVKTSTGDHKQRVFFSTDPTMSVPEILETYARRWSTEVCFRDLKQEFGFEDSQARKRKAVERTAPFVGYCYTTLVLWFTAGAWESPLAKPPVRPWYTQKQQLCFTDIVRCARRALDDFDVLDPEPALAAMRAKEARARHGPGDVRAAA